MTPKNTSAMLRLIALALAALTPLGAAAAQETDADLPKAEEVLDRYVEVTCGKAAYENVSNRKVIGSIAFIGAGIKGDLTLYQQAPNKMMTILELTDVGTIAQGTDGETAWESNPITGERQLEGEEKAAFLREADFYSELKWREIYETAKTTGKEDVEGTSCVVVELTPKQGKPETRYYAADSGLLLKTKRTIESPMGEVPVESLFSDYRAVNDIKIPFQSDETVVGQEIQTTIESVEHDVEIPADTFEVPAALKENGDSR